MWILTIFSIINLILTNHPCSLIKLQSNHVTNGEREVSCKGLEIVERAFASRAFKESTNQKSIQFNLLSWGNSIV